MPFALPTSLLTEPLTISVFAVLLAGLFLLQRRYGSSLRDIPGPFLASFSKGWLIWRAIKGDLEQVMVELHQKHGHFVRISHDEVSCSHPDAVRAILLAPLTKGDWYKATAIPDKHHQTAMSEVDPKRKGEMKKIFAPGYSLSNVLRSEDHLDHCLEGLRAHLCRFADAHEPVDLRDWFHYWTYDSVAGLVFSGNFGFLEKGTDIGGSIANSRVFLLYLTITAHAYWLHDVFLGNPILKWIGFKPTQHIMDTTEAAAEKRRRSPEAGQDMIEQWAMALRKSDVKDFKESDLVQNAASTITAGSDTTAVTLQSLIYYWLRYPAVYETLVTEVDAADAAGRLSPTVKASEAMSLPYLQAVLKECLRYFPPVPSGLPRKVPAGGLDIGGTRFPAGATLSVNPQVIQHSTECFGPTAKEFVPERWLGEEGKALEKYFITFGQGYNSCPGRQIAFAQLSKAGAMLIREFEFVQVDKGKPWEYKNRFGVHPHGWPVYITRRTK